MSRNQSTDYNKESFESLMAEVHRQLNAVYRAPAPPIYVPALPPSPVVGSSRRARSKSVLQ